MALIEEVQAAVKAGKAIIGYRRSLKSIRTGSAKLAVIAANVPEGMKKDIELNAKAAGIRLETFDGTSMQFGVICGKSFPISTLVIKS